jgi:hypothetical protein
MLPTNKPLLCDANLTSVCRSYQVFDPPILNAYKSAGSSGSHHAAVTGTAAELSERRGFAGACVSGRTRIVSGVDPLSRGLSLYLYVSLLRRKKRASSHPVSDALPTVAR